MFTGIVDHLGKFGSYIHSKREIIIEAPTVSPHINLGDSLAVNGVCLSMIQKNGPMLHFNLSEETLKQTNLGQLHRNDVLNLELPLSLSSLLSGHLVTGHIDGTEKVLKIQKRGAGQRITLSLSPKLKPFFIPKGSVAVNGVSLTLAEIQPSSFDVEVIPITLTQTNIGHLKRGDQVNIESDIIGKYVYNWVFNKDKGLTNEYKT
ncbi:MAG: riboflavin synthase [Candidatus Aminicenantes bacterium]|nr:riboflavin synthase [Candidatus Aminicenantes bacterium]